MKQVIVGNYYMGPESVEIVFREGGGGELYPTPELGHIARIKIGADNDAWGGILRVLLHEVMELAFLRVNCRYDSDNNLGNAHDSYLFVAKHADFTEVCARAAEFMSACLPDFEQAWKEYRNQKDLIKSRRKKPNGKK